MARSSGGSSGTPHTLHDLPLRIKLFLDESLVLACAAPLRAADKPVVYNNMSDAMADLDAAANEALSPKFQIVELRSRPGFAPPTALSGEFPSVARSKSGDVIGGTLLLAYVVTSEGKAIEPVVLKTSDFRLNSTAIRGMSTWRFTPATLNGVAIATVAAQQFDFPAIPTEFTVQPLEPTGGKLYCPNDWFLKQSRRGGDFIWTVSREEPAADRPYTTGVRIQVYNSLQKDTGKSPKQHMLDFIAKEKKEASKVLDVCPEEQQGLFTRTCIQVEEGPSRVMYSLYWSANGGDVGMIVSFGTNKDLWDVYAPAFSKIGKFELLDINRFGGE